MLKFLHAAILKISGKKRQYKIQTEGKGKAESFIPQRARLAVGRTVAAILEKFISRKTAQL